MSTIYQDLVKEAYEKLDYDSLYQSKVHGKGHIERVIKLGGKICEGENFPEDLSRLILICCSYHDIGRHNDWLDHSHGAKSAKKLQSEAFHDLLRDIPEDDVKIILASVSAHSANDKYIPVFEERYGIPSELHERYMSVVSSLKDADNLDRVRIGDLNVDYLRTDTAKSLASFAQTLFDDYKRGIFTKEL